jgi:3beta-hydroxy-Delta5-steroid dehydrogenase / steroid Delta-isomerase
MATYLETPSKAAHDVSGSRMSSPSSVVPIDPLATQRCLVTGGGGYLGRRLIDALLGRGCAVVVLDVVPEPEPRQGVTWVRGDLRDRACLERALQGVEVVFHTAALINLQTHASDALRERVMGVNVEGTRALLELAELEGVRRFVHVSSTNVVYGQETRGGDERGPYSLSEDLYSASKVEAEKLVLAANGRGSLRTAAIRPGGIYGPGERQNLVGPVVEALEKGAPVVCLGGEETLLDYTYVDNLVDGLLRAADRLVPGSPVCGEAYFVTDGAPMNPGAFSIELVRRMGIERRALRVPPFIGRAAAQLFERLNRRFGRPTPPFFVVSVELCNVDNYFSIEKARRDLGYAPVVELPEALQRTADEARAYYDSLEESRRASPSRNSRSQRSQSSG